MALGMGGGHHSSRIHPLSDLLSLELNGPLSFPGGLVRLRHASLSSHPTRKKQFLSFGPWAPHLLVSCLLFRCGCRSS